MSFIILVFGSGPDIFLQRNSRS